MKLEVCKVEFIDLKLTPRYSEKIRGYLGNKYNDDDLIHNHNNDKVIYRYPMVQYKVISNIPTIIGINSGVNIVSNIGLNDDEFVLDGKQFDTFQKRILKSTFEFGCEDDYLEYEFLTPWIALNQKNVNEYVSANSIEKEELLKKILIGNIISMGKGIQYTVDKYIHVWIDLKEINVMLKSIKHIGFIGKFKVNFNIPDYFGVGKSASRGFGTIKKV